MAMDMSVSRTDGVTTLEAADTGIKLTIEVNAREATAESILSTMAALAQFLEALADQYIPSNASNKN
jgi:hypothetical protein